nr:CRTAC1 family protein [Pyrinomonadaceae bacterium]
SAAQFLDYDNDGLLDLIAISGASLRVLRNVGNKWMDASSAAVKPDLLGGAAKQEGMRARHFVSGDTDADGDVDLIVSAGALKFARNDGGNANRSMRVWLAGKVSNRSGVGAKVEARTGSLWQKLETYAASPAPAPADVVFGLGQRTAPDAVRVLWPAGIVQAETEVAGAEGASGANSAKNPALAQSLTVTELDRKPSSCPYLFAWNGERFEFISDFMGGGEMGAWLAPGIRNQPDSDEYVRIRSDQLKERDGRYELRVTHELEEVLFMDRLKLIAVAHPADVEVYPNEGLTGPPHRTFKLYATHGARPPAKAVDDHGHDMLPRIAELDRQYPDDFKLHRLRGYAETHSLTLDLNSQIKGSPNGAANERTLLLLTGWTDYAFSSDNVAAEQCGMSLLPPALQVRNAKGEWQTVIPDMGIPIGRPQTVTVDLTGKFLSSSREVRITTNMRIYWDRILVDTSDGNSPTSMTELDPAVADLRWRGFSAEQTPDGREPYGYTYELVSPTSPWKTMLGRYTREGDVRPLLSRTDDMFVIARTGDQVSVSFDATKLPGLPAGWTRTFLLYVDGFSKEMDINSASPDQVMPLPFHGMSGYPYKATEAYPQTPEHREYMERYNTRVIHAPVPQLLMTSKQ